MIQTLIQKEDIKNFKLIPAQKDQTIHFREVLKYFERLGNEYKGKCKITFNTSEGARTVETTVWSVLENNVELKNAIIPLKCIIEVRH